MIFLAATSACKRRYSRKRWSTRRTFFSTRCRLQTTLWHCLPSPGGDFSESAVPAFHYRHCPLSSIFGPVRPDIRSLPTTYRFGSRTIFRNSCKNVGCKWTVDSELARQRPPNEYASPESHVLVQPATGIALRQNSRPATSSERPTDRHSQEKKNSVDVTVPKISRLLPTSSGLSSQKAVQNSYLTS